MRTRAHVQVSLVVYLFLCLVGRLLGWFGKCSLVWLVGWLVA